MKARRKLLIVAGIVFVGLVVLFATSSLGRFFLWEIFERRNIPFDRKFLEAVVRQVQKTSLNPGEDRKLRLEHFNDPTTLRPRRAGEYIARGKEAGDIWASRGPGGEWTVIVDTRDFGHAGSFGYAYSETEPQKYGDLYSFGEPAYLNCTEPKAKIDDKWWEVVTCYMD
jgi:hypothetical protein